MEQTLGKTLLVLGGCKSGKSSYALARAEAVPGGKRLFIATCVPYDDEMQRRVDAHKAEREDRYETAEVPVDVPEAITAMGTGKSVILVDCMTLWLSNLMARDDSDAYFNERSDALVAALVAAPCPVILVSNEVGGGIVPENRLARRFRDLAGILNRKVAAAADEVVAVMAGIPLRLKPRP